MAATKRQYVTLAEVSEYADIVISDNDEAYDQISLAEEMIDAYVGYQDKDIKEEYYGIATGGTTLTLIDSSTDTPLNFLDNYFKYCEIEVIEGTNSGQVRPISDYAKDTHTITVANAFTSAIDSTSVYVIRQSSKFPRVRDSYTLNQIYYKTIPDAVKRAVMAQVQYIIEMGTDFFMDVVDFDTESLDGVSYSVRSNANRIIAPKARLYLRGIMNRKGKLLV